MTVAELIEFLGTLDPAMPCLTQVGDEGYGEMRELSEPWWVDLSAAEARRMELPAGTRVLLVGGS